MSYAIYILIALQALDLISTVIALRNPNLVESNVILNPLFKIFGALGTLVVIKVSFAMFLWYYQADINQVVLVLMCVGYAYVVYNNLRLINVTPK